MRENIIKRIRDMDNVDFYLYNRYVSAVYGYVDEKRKDYKKLSDSYYTDEIPDDGILHSSDIEEMSDNEVKELFNDLETGVPLIGEKQINNVYLSHEYSLSGDYCDGGTVGLSNKNVLVEDYHHYEVIGGYGSSFAIIPLTFLLNEENIENGISDSILDVYQGLNEYPCIDEDELNQIESDGIDEAWDNWVRYDFINEISKKFNDKIDDIEEKFDKDCYELFSILMDRSNNYWFNDGGTDMWINIEDVVKSVEYDELKEYFDIIEREE